MIAHEDPSLIDWLLNVTGEAGDFLRTLASAALRADADNYSRLRPVLLQMKQKYPRYALASAPTELRVPTAVQAIRDWAHDPSAGMFEHDRSLISHFMDFIDGLLRDPSRGERKPS